MKRYESIGELLKEFRIYNSKTQLEMAEWLKVEDRTYRRWEKNENAIADDNIQDCAEKTGIPFEVLLRLNHDYPTLYNISNRRYSLCPFDRDYVNKKILQNELFDTKEIGRIFLLKDDQNFIKTKRIDFPAYPYEKEICGDLLIKSANFFPDLNIKIVDPNGFYSGHLVTIPLLMEKYLLLKNGKISENELRPDDVVELDHRFPMAFHIFSFFATTTTYAYCLAKRLIFVLLASVPSKLHAESLLSRYTVTNDGAEFCRKFGMELIRWGFEDYQNLKVEVVPHFFEQKINEIKWLEAYKNKIGKI